MYFAIVCELTLLSFFSLVHGYLPRYTITENKLKTDR